MPLSYRAVFFDFGGTLYSYRSRGLGLRPVLGELLDRLEVEVDRSRIPDAFRRASRAAYQNVLPQEFYLHRDLFTDTYRRFAIEIAGVEPGADLLDWCHRAQCRRVIDNHLLRDDCLATLGRLRAEGLHVAIVSNIDDDYLQPMVEKNSLSSNLDAWTSSEEARSCKPHEKIFQVALAKAGCAADDTLFVGDSLEADVAGAKRLGMTTVYLREGEARAPGAEDAAPDHVVTALSEILSLAGIECPASGV